MFSTSSLFRSKGVKEPTITEYYTLDVDDETTYKRIDQKKTILSNLYCRIMIGLSITCCLLSFGFLTKCPYFEEPTSQWHDKLKKYFVDQGNYETVSFMSRDADWIEGGIGKVKVVGTLYKQPIINSTSRFIVTVHGYTACRFKYETMLASTMLYHMGFNILQIDLRNHGDTGIFKKLPYASFGSFEHLDVLGALDYLQQKYPFLDNNSFGIFGTSMGAATSLIAFSKDKRIKQAFVDSPPIDIFETIHDGAKQIVGSSVARIAIDALKSIVPHKAQLMGFPPFHNDVKSLLEKVDLSNDRKIFLMHVEGDLVVPTFNYYEFWKAVNTSLVNNKYSPSSVETFLGQVDYSYNDRTRKHCSKHLNRRSWSIEIK
ncbi:predicted protein [Naegleria gruberi]|uniref:Predicted protein n=1 Tax=Naegleria gruberi TaxID=5762 RepID=D2VKT3_NAEGR|nr:uncharacterized protein NAEGRDRAFT_69504 [Naegleria gruberi]EFC42652.1 predicted protein [Naegleria gruberi]|eukprot:XP_002675396.1 predicted protein [Naegleria gruberi strain NEG-M]